MDTKEIFSAVGNFGFPMVLSWYLLLRMEQRLDKLGDCLHELSSAIVKEQKKLNKGLNTAIARRAIAGTIKNDKKDKAMQT